MILTIFTIVIGTFIFGFISFVYRDQKRVKLLVAEREIQRTKYEAEEAARIARQKICLEAQRHFKIYKTPNESERRILSSFDKYLRGTPKVSCLLLPLGDNYTEIDIIVFSTKGIFVLEVKGYAGTISGLKDDKYWMQTVDSEMRLFHNPIKQNRGHIHALQAFTGLPEETFISMVVFEGSKVVVNVDIPGMVFKDKECIIEILRYEEDLLSEQQVQETYMKCKTHFVKTPVELYHEHVQRLEKKYVA